MNFTWTVIAETWRRLLEASVYVIFGLLISGLLRIFLSPQAVAHHFSRGRFLSVFKAAAIGVPIPLCSCGVLPAAVGLKKQGANNGAITAFLIATPESGVDSIAITYALLDPLMTVARPLVAFVSAVVGGLVENFWGYQAGETTITPDLSCTIDRCCDGQNCPPEEHAAHHRLREKIWAGVKYAFDDVWADMAGWYLLGLVLAGLITTLVPMEFMTRHLGGGLSSMLIMLAVGIPLYICATASTPIAAALILKGVSPGAALVFLLAGPATNVTSLTVLFKILGRRATLIYLTAIAICSVAGGLMVDQVYAWLNLSPKALIGQAAELIPLWLEWLGAVGLLALSFRQFHQWIRARNKSRIEPTVDLIGLPQAKTTVDSESECASPT
ncbi:MAG: SO_0444 family Cu/Zn efflux transporter [Deltaproteobacteria bacterium]|nr:SO_0444 family Cu/Zn efflux transporter [Deltaproteobacteria bacterium]